MHLSERDLGALLHGEGRHPAFVEHLGICVDCAQRLRAGQAAERITGQQLAMLDHAVPRISPQVVMVPRKSKMRMPLRQIAAGVTLLFLAVGAAAAIPASPIHKVLLRVVAELGSRGTAGPTLQKEPSSQRDAQRSANTNSGVLFLPDSSLEVVFLHAQASGSIHVTLVNESVVSLKSLGGSSSFDLGRRQILANNGESSGSYAISVPLTLKTVVIRIGADTVFKRAGSDVWTVGRTDGHDSFSLPLSTADRKPMTAHRIQ